MTTPQNRYWLRSAPDTDTDESDSEAQTDNCSLEDTLELSDISDIAEETVLEAPGIPLLPTLEETRNMASHIHPPKFNGESGSRASNWLKQYEDYIKLAKLDNDAKLLSFSFFLEGKAKKLYEGLPLATQQNYNQLTEAIKTRFNGDDGISQGFGLWALSRMPSESVDDYFLRVQSLCNGSAVPESFLISAAMKGLSPEIQRIVMPQTNIKTLEDLRIATTLAERTVLSTSATSASVNAAAAGLEILQPFMKQLTEQLRELTMATRSRPEDHGPATYSRRRYPQTQDNRRNQNRRQQYACRNCRGMVPHSLPQCPAYNQKCTNCNGRHHTAAVCEKERSNNYQ